MNVPNVTIYLENLEDEGHFYLSTGNVHYFAKKTSNMFISGFAYDHFTCKNILLFVVVVVVIDLPLLRVAVEGSDNPVSLEKPCQASLPPDQQGRHSLGKHPEVQYVA